MRFVHISLIFLVLAFSSCKENSRFPSSDYIDVVLDLDSTLVKDISWNPDRYGDFVKVGDVNYKIFNYATLMIQKLLENPRVRISFFSGGPRERNYELLKKLKLEDGRTLYDISYKVLSKEELTQIVDLPGNVDFSTMYLDHGIRYSEAFKKDLTKINTNLDNLIILDDNKLFALNEVQKKNFLWVGGYIEFYENFASYVKDMQSKSENFVDTKTLYKNWIINKNRLLIALDTIEKALAVSEDEGVSFKQAVNELSLEEKLSKNQLDHSIINSLNDGLAGLGYQKRFTLERFDRNISCKLFLVP